MYISCHEQFTTQSLHRRGDNSAASRFNQNNSKRRRIAFLRTMMFVLLFALAVSFGAIVTYAAQEAGSLSSSAASQAYESVVVYEGDTLWSIAAEHRPQQIDIRTYIRKIQKLNQLSSAYLQEGQVLLLP